MKPASLHIPGVSCRMFAVKAMIGMGEDPFVFSNFLMCLVQVIPSDNGKKEDADEDFADEDSGDGDDELQSAKPPDDGKGEKSDDDGDGEFEQRNAYGN